MSGRKSTATKKKRAKPRKAADYHRDRRNADAAIGPTMRSWEAAADRNDVFGMELLDHRAAAAVRDSGRMKPKYRWP